MELATFTVSKPAAVVSPLRTLPGKRYCSSAVEDDSFVDIAAGGLQFAAERREGASLPRRLTVRCVRFYSCTAHHSVVDTDDSQRSASDCRARSRVMAVVHSGVNESAIDARFEADTKCAPSRVLVVCVSRRRGIFATCGHHSRFFCCFCSACCCHPSLALLLLAAAALLLSLHAPLALCSHW